MASPVPTTTQRLVLRGLCAAVVLTLGAQPLWAQHYRFRVLSNADGLPQIQAMAVLQDSHGYMWVGTYGGAARYNGERFDAYHTAHGLPGSTVYAFAEIPGFGVLLGTNAGLALFRHGRMHVVQPPRGPHAVEVTGMLVDGADLWVATAHGLWRIPVATILATIDPDAASPGDAGVHYGIESGLPSTGITAIFRPAAGSLWVGTNAGVARFDGDRFVAGAPGLPAEAVVNAIAEAGDRTLWLATREGIYSGLPGIEPFRRLQHRDLRGPQTEWVYTAATTPDGVAWFGTRGGAIRVDATSVEIVSRQRGLPSDNVYDIHVDREANIWFGTDTGLARLTPGPFVALTTSEGLPHNFVRAIEEDFDQRVWLGTRDGVGVREPDGRVWTIGAADGLTSTRVYDIGAVPDGTVLIGTSGGVFVWDDGIVAHHGVPQGLAAEAVRDILVDADGSAWIGTRGGISRFVDGRMVDPPDLRLRSLSVIDLTRDDRGRLWIGTYNDGLYLWDGQQLNAMGLDDIPIWSLAPDGAGGVWVGTNGSGIHHFGDSPRPRLSEDDGLVNDFVWQVLVDRRGHLWAYTNSGLDRWDGQRFHHYDQEDGLLDLEGAAHAVHEDSRGHLWFGTGFGVMRYLPERERLVGADVAPLVAIERVEELEAGTFVEHGSRLERWRDSIAFSFAGLTFRNENATVFRYRLVGLDPAWSAPTPERRISYASLPAGDYVFEVLAGTKPDLWSAEPARFAFRIDRGWYETLWFRALVAVVLVAAIVLLYRLRTKQLQHERRRLAKEVEARTREVLEQRQQRAEAEASSRAKSDFLARMSHEIRTPLNGVLGMTQLLLQTETTSKQRRYLESVRQSGSALLHLVNDVLDVSKIEAGRLDLEETEFDPWETVNEVAEIFGPAAFSKGVELICDVGAGLPAAVIGDSVRLRQVLINLTGNAVKFTDEGQIVVSVRTLQMTDESVVLRYEVSDTGIGIAQETREAIFDSFRQADVSTTRKYGGTGLGLAISRQLVELMGGSLDVESEVGVGTTFGFTLTLARRPHDPDRGGRHDDPTPTFEGHRALIVDDNAVSRDLLEEHMRSWGQRVSAVESGAQALETLETAAAGDDPYDIVVLDLSMPDMDGLELARRIRDEPLLAESRLVMLASVGRNVDAEEIESVGVDACLQRPVHPAALRNAVYGRQGSGEGHDGSVGEIPRTIDATILLAEDNDVNRDVAIAMLEELGCTVIVARDGVEAVDIARGRYVDLILMDCEMPIMDGFDATAALREAGGASGRVPIVALTANALARYRARCLDVGMDDYLSKPYVLEQLADVVARWVPRDVRRSAAPPPRPAPEHAFPSAEPASMVAPGERSDEVIDLAVVQQIRELESGAEGLLGRVVDNWLKGSDELLAQIAEAIRAGDVEALRVAAHTLKSSSHSVGAVRLAHSCESLENEALAGRLPEDVTLADVLRGERDLAREILVFERAA